LSDAYTKLLIVTILTGPCAQVDPTSIQPLDLSEPSGRRTANVPGCNVRLVNNDTLIPILQRAATINITVPLLIRLVKTNLPGH
jgi:hypothetical protein